MRSDPIRLQDILDAIQVIEKYLPIDRASFNQDPPLQSHRYRHLMIVGEAAWSLTDTLKRQNSHIPWRQIEGMRHIMVHDYFKVNWNRVYETARDHVPILKPQVQAILASFPNE